MSYRSHNITILVYKLIKSIDLLRKNKMQKKESTCNFHDLTNGNNILRIKIFYANRSVY